MRFSWCGGSNCLRTNSVDLGSLQPGSSDPAAQRASTQSKESADNLKPRLVKIQSVVATSSGLHDQPASPSSALGGDSPPNPLKENEKYVKVADIGVGASAFVVLAQERVTLKDVAIKFIDRGTTAIKTAGKEVLNQRLCCMHPNIIQLHEVFLTPVHLAIVSELAPGGDLVDYIERHSMSHECALQESAARWLFQQLIVAVDYCHQMGIANRDIKLENTLLMDTSERPVLKLCDFGYSKDELCASISKTMCGTPEYVAPEVLLYNKYAGKMADIWSCGILLYCMLTGCFPFRRQEDEGLEVQAVLQKMLPRILKADYQKPQGLTDDCYDILSRLLEVDPDKRITVQQILKHPWFTQDMPEGLQNLNDNLLQIPLSMQTGCCIQTEDELSALTTKAAQSRRPRVSSSFGSGLHSNSGLRQLYY
ncbi:hypothetical protein ABBQ38_006715 [Trebouxia sp. C0009 RCD-2024]